MKASLWSQHLREKSVQAHALLGQAFGPGMWVPFFVFLGPTNISLTCYMFLCFFYPRFTHLSIKTMWAIFWESAGIPWRALAFAFALGFPPPPLDALFVPFGGIAEPGARTVDRICAETPQNSLDLCRGCPKSSDFVPSMMGYYWCLCRACCEPNDFVPLDAAVIHKTLVDVSSIWRNL